MKRLSLLVLGVLLFINVNAQKSVDLFIWAGQSNAQGWTGDAALYPEDTLGLDKSILLNWTFYGKESSGGEWVNMQAQKGRYEKGHFGPEVSFSRELKQAGYHPAIFKYCLGGTGLARDWKTPGEGGIYDHMVTELKPAIKKLQDDGYKVNIRGFIWIQGETDAGDEKTAGDYQQNLQRLLNHLRSNVLKVSNLKIILGVDEQHGFVKNRPIVVDAQKRIANNDVNIIYTTMYGLPKADATHLTPIGLVEHGKRIFNAYQILSTENKKPIDVYLIGGQSNATGQGYIKNIPTYFKLDQSVQFYYSRELGGGGVPLQWGLLCQASETPDRFGPELSMGTALKKAYPDREIAMIKHGLSGSNLYYHWNPGKDKSDSINFGPEYKKFINTVVAGLKDLERQGYKPQIKAMVWQQGEGDARDIAGMENSNNYGKNLNHFIKRVRQHLEAPEMLFIYGYVIPVPLERFTGREEVRLAQKQLSQNSGHPLAVKGAFVVETDDLPLRCDEPNSPYLDDKIHFNTFGILELGKRFAEKINAEIK